MRMITGALLLMVAEQAFYHAHSIGFPHYRFVNEVLLPLSGLLAVIGVILIGIGLWFDRPPPPRPSSDMRHRDRPDLNVGHQPDEMISNGQTTSTHP